MNQFKDENKKEVSLLTVTEKYKTFKEARERSITAGDLAEQGFEPEDYMDLCHDTGHARYEYQKKAQAWLEQNPELDYRGGREI